MSRVNPYASIAKRNLESAMMHMLETEYGLLGGRRILSLLVEDTLALMEEFYPAMERVGSGDLVLDAPLTIGSYTSASPSPRRWARAGQPLSTSQPCSA